MKIIQKVLLGLLIFGSLLLVNYFDRNILNAMYEDARDGGILFNNVKETDYIDYDRWWFMTSSGFFSIKYKEEYLQDGYEIWLFYSDEEPNILEVGSLKTLANDNRLYVIAEYNYEMKKLTWLPLEISIPVTEDGEVRYKDCSKEETALYLEEAGITKAVIKEHQNYVLKEVVLKTWAKGNVRFPFDLLKGVKVIDYAWNFAE